MLPRWHAPGASWTSVLVQAERSLGALFQRFAFHLALRRWKPFVSTLNSVSVRSSCGRRKNGYSVLPLEAADEDGMKNGTAL